MIYIAMATGFLLILIGFYGALTNRNLLRMIVAFSIADTGVNLVIISVGYMPGRTAPILDASVTCRQRYRPHHRPGAAGAGAQPPSSSASASRH